MDVSTSEKTLALARSVWTGHHAQSPIAVDPAPHYVAAEQHILSRSDRQSRRTVLITGLATAVPPLAIGQDEAGEIAAGLTFGPRARTVPVLYRRSGIKSRHSVLLEKTPDGAITQSFYPPPRNEQDRGPTTCQRMHRYATEAPSLGETACRQAIWQAEISPRDVTHLITVSCTGFSAPGTEFELISRLGLSPEISRTNVGFMGCHGLMNGLRMASAVSRGEPDAVVLVCAVELCTLHHQYTNAPQQIVANALFSDGAATLIVQSGQPGSAHWQLEDQRSLVLPQTDEMMTWRIGNHGFEMTLSPRLPDVIRANLKPWLSRWLKEHKLKISDIKSWAIHPGGPRILTAAAEGAGFDAALLKPSRDILTHYGNMSSPTIAFILERLFQDGAETPTVILAFGPGLTIEAGLMMPNSRDSRI